MTAKLDPVWIEAPHEERPDLARALLDAAERLGLDPTDPQVVTSTSDGFKVRGDVLEASGLHDSEASEDGGDAAVAPAVAEAPAAETAVETEAPAAAEAPPRSGGKTAAKSPKSSSRR